MEKPRSIYKLIPTRGLKCAGCNYGDDYYSAGYRCFRSGFFFHEECVKSDPKISNPYHPQHSLYFKFLAADEDPGHGSKCKLCRGNLPKMYYYCSICDFAIDLICAKKKVITTIEGSKTHEHPLSLVPKMGTFTCHVCGLQDDRFPYSCNQCDLRFHKDCAESSPEIEYPCHLKHVLKRYTRVPRYANGKCSLCENKLHYVFYHCSICNFSVDVDCAKNPPPSTILHDKAHEHVLTLMPQRSFVCDVCGMDDDPNPYVCPPCNFMVHRKCISIPRVIKVYRHDHRVYYNHCLDAGDWKCGVCNKEINWTRGAYSCLQCHDFAIHSRCATRFRIWDGIDLEGVPEDNLEVKSYEVIGEGEIKHFSHEKHSLKLQVVSDGNDEDMWCKACNYPIYSSSSSFYMCMECDDFILHEKCAYLPKKKIDSFHHVLTTLNTTNNIDTFACNACQNLFQGFRYESYVAKIFLDVRCGSISEPFVHESHPLHSLYVSPSTEGRFCNACGDKATMLLSCEECGFAIDTRCSILPKMAKHNVDKDHVLSLCYGLKTSEKYWCEICEEELKPEKWFYGCDDCGITNHIKCTVGDFMLVTPEKFMDKSDEFYMIHNNRINQPICFCCHSRCQFSTILKAHGKPCCSRRCLQQCYDQYRYGEG